MSPYSVTLTTKDRDYYLQLAEVSADLKEQILSADVLFVPAEYSDCPTAFTHGTQQFLQYCKQNLNCKVDVCCNDSDFKEIELNSRLSRFGTFIMDKTLWPLFIGTMGSYMTQLFPLSPVTEPVEETRPYLESPKIQFSVIIEDADSAKQEYKKFEFEGTAKDFKDVEQELKDLAK